ELWRTLAVAHVTCSEALGRSDLWKKVACLAKRQPTDDKQLLGEVEAFSSADRPSESPVNTLTSSRCWTELHQLQKDTEQAELTTLGERIQHRCGCSSGQSCYWSSSASTNQNATEFIDYALNGPCVVNAVQIVPYRVFWHPDSPTYAPKRVRFEFFDVDDMATLQRGAAGWRNQPLVMRASAIKPFYASRDYEVKNDMTLQEFVLPRKVVASKKTLLRITLLGRHQAQTFELPQAFLNGDEDQRPKYYCCLSYVNVCGVPWQPVQQASEPSSAIHPYTMSPNLRMAALTGLAVYMTACYEGFIGRTRRWE
ncbi:F-box protein, partial [Phytophthora megakarya]